MSGNITLNKEHVAALSQLLDYVYSDEERNYEECELNGVPTGDHIFNAIRTLAPLEPVAAEMRRRVEEFRRDFERQWHQAG